jgi:hypothetical protein
MTVPEAAAELGYSESAIKQAVASGRLPARKIRNVLYLDPAAVKAYTGKRRGPRPSEETAPEPPVEPADRSTIARIGSKDGASFRIKGAQIVGAKEGALRQGLVALGWTRILVLASKPGGGARFWAVEPDPDRPLAQPEMIRFDGFYLIGPFRIVDKDNNEHRAREKFAAG